MAISTKTSFKVLCFFAAVFLLTGTIMTMYGNLKKIEKDPNCEWLCNMDEKLTVSQLRMWGPIILVTGFLLTAGSIWYYRRRLVPLQDYHSRQQTYGLVQMQQSAVGATAPPVSYPSLSGSNHPPQSGYPVYATHQGYPPPGQYPPPSQYPPPGQYPPPQQYPIAPVQPNYAAPQPPNYQQNNTILGVANTGPPPSYNEVAGGQK